MIFVAHHTTAPRKLRQRFAKGIPANPGKAWKSFSGKQELKDNLFSIQNGLCAYCEIRLDTSIGRHLEHVIPKTPNPAQTFVYTNIVASCINDSVPDHTDPKPISCGHAKKQLSIAMKPTDTHCETYFRYDLFGKVKPAFHLSPNDTQIALNTIDTLNLNCLRLQRQRESIIEEGFTIIKDLKPDTEALGHFLDLELNTVNGKFFSFINLRREHFSGYLIA